MGWTWYLANDMQFYVIAPVFIILFFWKKVIGWVSVALACVWCFIQTAYLVREHNMSMTVFSSRSEEYFNHIYTKPYGRAPAYFVGILLAFFVLSLRKKIHIPWVARWALFVGAAGVMSALVFSPYDDYHHYIEHGSTTWSEGQNVAYITFARFSWCCALAVICYLLMAGEGFDLLRDVLQSPLWTPFARLTYSTYLIHPVVMSTLIESIRTYVHHSVVSMILFFFGFSVLSYAFATVVYVGVERPMMNLEKLILPQRRH